MAGVAGAGAGEVEGTGGSGVWTSIGVGDGPALEISGREDGEKVGGDCGVAPCGGRGVPGLELSGESLLVGTTGD